jgi:periplasmic divalent cation tolerance protein
MASDTVVVLVTCPPQAADGLAQTLVQARVAACVNVVPGVRSVYRWQGQVTQDEESLLLIKTTTTRFEALRTTVMKHHPYELPEVVALPVALGHAPYLDWVAREVAAQAESP